MIKFCNFDCVLQLSIGHARAAFVPVKTSGCAGVDCVFIIMFGLSDMAPAPPSLGTPPGLPPALSSSAVLSSMVDAGATATVAAEVSQEFKSFVVWLRTVDSAPKKDTWLLEVVKVAGCGLGALFREKKEKPRS